MNESFVNVASIASYHIVCHQNRFTLSKNILSFETLAMNAGRTEEARKMCFLGKFAHVINCRISDSTGCWIQCTKYVKKWITLFGPIVGKIVLFWQLATIHTVAAPTPSVAKGKADLYITENNQFIFSSKVAFDIFEMAVCIIL